ncbi:hypothetical protein SHKM778_55850 [Streptomyces sp. KM77-8]|uniref:Uncharacterized protein n=1 Tax=Streptomyces haneummycinicus TaxID=3074435 RepID=A0AAT9HPI1_9ACTN
MAELTFDSLVDAIPVRGATDVPRMLTFTAGEVTLDVEVTAEGLLGQVLPPQPGRVEVLGGPLRGSRSSPMSWDGSPRRMRPPGRSPCVCTRVRTWWSRSGSGPDAVG